MAELTADEHAIYDRQLRVWGLETQHKLRQSKVLIAGCTGLAAEIAKNIVLAGVGSVILVDETPCSGAAPGNFLVPYDAKDVTVAEACVATLQEMNPLVSVTAAAGLPATFFTPENLAGFNLVILVGQSGAVVDAADAACFKADVPFISACSRGMAGWAFANLHTHHYILEKKKEQSDGTTTTTTEECCLEGISWEKALAAAMEKRTIKRMSPLLPILRVFQRFEREQGRAAVPSDVEAIQFAVETLVKEEGLAGGAIESWVVGSLLEHTEEMPAINSMVGGVVANDVIKIVAAKGEPLINNLFLYSLLDGAGFVERLGSEAA